MASESYEIHGQWSEVFSWPLIGLHVIITPDNKILSFGTDQRGAQGGSLVYDVWDLATNTHHTLTNQTVTDIFCSACILVPSTGEILITGGDRRPLGAVNHGVNDVNVYDYRDMSLSASSTGNMEYQRWYPTVVTLSNGKVLVSGGSDGDGKGVGMPELYTPDSGWKTLTGAYSADIAANWFYPRTFLNSEGNVVLFATNSTGQSAVHVMDASGDGSIRDVGKLPFIAAQSMPAILYAPNKVLALATDGSTWIIDIGGKTPTYTRTEDVGLDRQWSNLVVLADGTVLVSGGSAVDTLVVDRIVDAKYEAAIWHPDTGEWTYANDAHLARLYHSTTILLPDGTVLSLGGGAPGPVTNTNGEIYRPAYLFNADGTEAKRPVINDAPTQLAQNQSFIITVDEAENISKLTFVKAGSATHALNMSTIAIELQFTALDGHTLRVTPPENSNILTPGHWMLFVLNDKGTPSEAATIQVDVGGELYSDAVKTFLTLNGSASHDDASGIFTLTGDAKNASGSVMSNEKLDLGSDFQVEFDAYFGSNDLGSDGIGFVLLNDPDGADATGKGGGYLGLTGIRSGLGIEFDTYDNKAALGGDLAADHTNFVDTDAADALRNISAPISLGNIEDGGWHSVVVNWDAESQTLRYWFDGALAGTLQRDIVTFYLGGSTLAHFGFTGATGGSSNLQQIRLVSLDGRYNDSATAGSQIDPVQLAGKIDLSGTAHLSQRTGVITLTPDSGNKLGAATFNDRINLAHDFSIVFQVNLGSKEAGADGVGFVLHNDPRGTEAAGRGGGYLGLTGLIDGLGIELDTFNNEAALGGDLAADYTNFVDTDTADALRNISAPMSLGNIEDGGWHSVVVDWDVESQTLRYWFDGTLAGTLQRDIVNTYLGGSSLAYFGFTGATGGASNLQQVRIVSLEGEQNSTPGGATKFDPVELANNLRLAGDALYDLGNGVLTLTPEMGSKTGAATFNDRINLAHDFSIVFQVNLGSKEAGADGVAFLFHNDPRGPESIGQAGGYLGLTGILHGLGIEFDTYNNGNALGGDLATDHTNFIDTDAADANRNVTNPFSLGNIEDGGWHNVVVDWDAETQTLRYWFDGVLAETLQRDIVNTYLGGSSLAYFGFTGATGEINNLQQVKVQQLLGTLEQDHDVASADGRYLSDFDF